jgi:hypothetical protein
MPIVVPPAQIVNAETGLYRPINADDGVTSGGDIGAQVPINPVVWVSFPVESLLRSIRCKPFFDCDVTCLLLCR